MFYRDAEAIGRDAQLLAANQFELTALDVQATLGAVRGELRLLVRVASSPAATEAQLAAIRRMVTGEVQLMTGGAEDGLWRDQVGAPWISDRTVVRLAWLPASLATVLTAIDRAGRESGAALTFTGRTAVGAGMVRVDGSIDAAVAVIEELRRSDAVGNVVVLRAPAAVKSRIEVWGPPRDVAPVMHAIKTALDPSGILNAGRGPV